MFRYALSLLTLAMISACAAEDLELDADPRPSEHATLAQESVPPVHVDDWGSTSEKRPATPVEGLPPQCPGLQEAAATVLGAYQHCTVDADCGTTYVNGYCLNSFLCPVAVNERSDLERLQREASALSFAWRRACATPCAVASCAAPSRTYCDRASKRCKSDF